MFVSLILSRLQKQNLFLFQTTSSSLVHCGKENLCPSVSETFTNFVPVLSVSSLSLLSDPAQDLNPCAPLVDYASLSFFP